MRCRRKGHLVGKSNWKIRSTTKQIEILLKAEYIELADGVSLSAEKASRG
jgi:hypothetical protein